ncbi:MAG: NTP transferase domain-containing protein [Candidatus Bathyarchaeota archaeon]|nr:NTP transferase domain-containing protein [Candidatus Bathyarchaeota archaeon]MDW8040607.1 NTP transferase domain-containing protein [Nitrososphaerota archaeon]
MKLPALIMAGGKGKRFCSNVEKPLAPFMGKPLIDWVVKAIQSASKISDFYIVTSPDTPKTEEKCLRESLKVIHTDGRGYHDDLKQAIIKGKLFHPVLTVSSDLPALTGSFIDKIVSIYEHCGKPALTVLVPVEKFRRVGLSTPSLYNYGGLCYAVSGVNVIDGSKISEGEMDQEVLILEDVEAVINVNSYEDLKKAEHFLSTISRTETF